MPRKSRIKKITVKIASEIKEKDIEASKEGGKTATELRKEDIKKSKKTDKKREGGLLVERFIIPMIKQPLQSLQQLQLQQIQPLSLQPWPIESAGDASIYELKQLLNDEKARILNVVKLKKPVSLYHLAKLVSRDFKAVRDDVKLLEKFGFLKLVAEKEGKKKRLRPVLALDKLQVTIEV